MQHIYINKTINMLFFANNYLIKIVDMDVNWFNSLFEREYENVMNNVVQYVSHGYASRNSSSHISYSCGVTDDRNSDNDGDNDDNNIDDDNDDADDSFSHREFDRRKLILCIADGLTLYYNNYIYKQPCMILYNIGMQWLNEILNGHCIRCVNMFRMDATTSRVFVLI